MLDVDLAILSEPGGREANEDACGYLQVGDRLCCVVADGAGGHGGGGQASRVAVQALLDAFSRQPTRDAGELAALVRQANAQVRDARHADPALADMFTTLACVVIDLPGRRAHWAHAGDTRIYWFRHGRVAARSKDHSVVQSMADLGLLADADLRTHPRRSELLCALGSEPDDLQVGQGEANDLGAGADAFLLCTDGLWEHAPDGALEDALAEALERGDGAQAWLRALEAQVLRSATGMPRHDNYSGIAARMLAAGPNE